MGVNDGLLDQFCEWVGNHEEANAWHHDIAVLLTKQVICDGGNNCNTLGELGYLETVRNFIPRVPIKLLRWQEVHC